MKTAYSNSNVIRSVKMLRSFWMILLIFLGMCIEAQAQPTSWVNEGFAASPYPSSANYFLSNGTNSWTQGEIVGIVGFPNLWVYTIAGGTTPTYPTIFGGFVRSAPAVTVANHGQFAGAGYLQYNNRNTNYPAAPATVAPAGDAAYIASRSLDFSGHTAYNALTDTFGFWFYRDSSTIGTVNTIADSIVVYLNTEPILQGPNLVRLTEKNILNTYIPRSSTIAPLQGPVGNGWRRCTYTIPNIPAYTDALGNATSTAFVIVVAYSRGGNNMFLDDFTLPEWQTPMTIQAATIYYQEVADVSKNSTGNLILGVKVTTKGSGTPLKIDAATFSPAGSNNYAADVQNPLVYYTGAVSNFATAGGAIQMPANGIGPGVGLLNFGWWAASCGATATPATMQLSPGTENFIWLTYDIKAAAITGDFVGADFQYLTTRSSLGTCYYAGLTVSTNLATNPITPQTLNHARLIDFSYPVPTYTGGLGVPGFWDFDCVSAVNLPGDNSTLLNNYYHDDSCSGCHSVHPLADPLHIYCIRWACHPPDYTNFHAINAGTFKNRFVQITRAKGVRTGTPPYFLHAIGGNVSGRVAVFIDWNRDGDFDDTYTGTTGIPAQNVVIPEDLGTLAQPGNTTYMNQFPITVWPANSQWVINVPDVTDVVTDLGLQPPAASTTPLSLSNVRLRIRQCVNAVTIGPFTNGYTEGETEDYTLQILDNCPAPGLNVCRWIGSTSDWNTISNWCPSIPTINDMAYIGIVNTNLFSYPVIGSNTQATCRQLKIMDNGVGTAAARVTIDAPRNSSLVVADDILIGQNAPAAGSPASVSVISDFKKAITIPGKSSVPPAGTALISLTPWKTNAHSKTQISYTATELASTFGWKAGDIIDSLGFEASLVSGAATPPLTADYHNFRIRAFLTSVPITFQNPAPANTKIAIEALDPNIVAGWPKTIFTADSFTMSMQVTSGGTQANGNYQVINLIPNTLVWDGVSNLVLSIEYATTNSPIPTPVPARSYTLYDEASSGNNCLALTYNTNIVLKYGWQIDGNTHQSTGNLPGVAAAVSNFRPRIDYYLHRPYERFDITVGGNIYNNNKLVRTAPFSVTPVYGIPGDSGFIAGFSKVIFDPTIRTTVNSPGLTSTNSFNPTAQPALLVADQDQNITSTNNANTVFSRLEINKVSATAKVVKQNSTTLNVLGAYADSLALTNGELMLNSKLFTLTNPAGSNVARTNGWIRSENTTGTISSLFKWKIGTNTGVHSIPFGKSSSDVFPLDYNGSSGDVGDLTVGTYGTTPDNAPVPISPVAVLGMTTNPNPTIVDARGQTVDRFWYLKRTTTGVISNQITFRYNTTNEGTVFGAGSAIYSAGNMRAQRYAQSSTGLWGWNAPLLLQTNAIAGSLVSVMDPVNDTLNSANWTIWAITNISSNNGPLPLQLVNFDAKLIDKKVRIWWDVQSESDVAKYTVERTIDQNDFDFITNKAPLGPSTGLLNYETFDNNPVKGINYYRLKTISTNGDINYSDLKPVNVSGIFEITKVTTNASASFIQVDFFYDNNLPYSYNVTDMYGHKIAQGSNRKASTGENTINIPVQLSRGIYFVTLANEEKSITQKIVY